VTTDPLTTDPLTTAVREQIALGRLLPLGGPGDALWITESTAVAVLRRACAQLPGVRLGAVEVTLVPGADDADDAPEDRAGAPPSALPHVPVRVAAGFEAGAGEPLPLAAERLREVLWQAADTLVGLAVAAVDLHVTGLLEDDGAEPGATAAPGDAATTTGAAPRLTPEAVPESIRPLAVAALAVPGVTGLTRRLAGFGTGLRLREGVRDGAAQPDAAPDEGVRGRSQVQVQIAVQPGLAPLQVAREVVTAVTAAAPAEAGPVTVSVVVTDA